jgi:hypothetical protein
MDRIPILKLRKALLVTIRVDAHERLATTLEEDVIAVSKPRPSKQRRADRSTFRLAGWPLPGGSRTLWITAKDFRSRHPSFLAS